ncbi:MAG: NADPH-dependent 7-cyano-7-deazaguanine reductase QueF [Alphaproteobacteria bacterium]|nr:NADPH-dependent 7-cyano-7-deazaguanine reductase QueF [Rickettsiales bacterium]
MSKKLNLKHLSILGNNAKAAKNPNEAKLEAVPNANQGINYVTRFTCPEFTSLCPVTGQPDFARIVIDYIPDQYLVESKSLKLFLQSFRNHNDFHESCTIFIANKIIDITKPKWLRVSAYWYPRGGIPIDVFFQTGSPPDGVWIEPITIPTFSGR